MEDERYKEVVPSPTFVEQAQAYVDIKFKESEAVLPQFKPGLNIADHKIWIGVMDIQVKHVYEILIENFNKKVAEHYDPIMETLKRLEEKQDAFSAELIRISKKENEDVKRLEIKIMDIIKRVEDKKKRIEVLERTKYNLDNLSRAGEIVMKLDKKLKIIIWLCIGGFVTGGLIMLAHLIELL
jgi:superfamily II RNA helicase